MTIRDTLRNIFFPGSGVLAPSRERRFLAIEARWRKGRMDRTDFEGLLLYNEKFRAWYIARHRSEWARRSESRDVSEREL